ncbi:MAG: aldehyde dehydrogenase family protein [Acidimicrobiia bacterium]|nr:aldehyde dehydrogenase family protein [Acidimicrobiia bacterium]
MTEPGGIGLECLTAGQQIPFGGDRVTSVSEELAAAFEPGDRLVVVQDTGALLHVPRAEHELVTSCVSDAVDGFAQLARCPDGAVTSFFDRFAAHLSDERSFAPVAAANAADVASAAQRGRSTTRLVLGDRMRAEMVAGLEGWRDSAGRRDETVRTIEHDGWSVDARRAPLGVVGFVFEGRPNVFADACGVVRTGNAVVFRIGSDALGTARAIVEHALAPALSEAGLPPGVVRLVDSRSHAAGHALFADRRLGLAVARGSGRAVAELGAVAAQSGVPVSLHGTGGAWIVAGESAAAAPFGAAVRHSLDRKVCNTLNVCAIPAARADELVPVFLDALDSAAAGRSANARLHVATGSEPWVPMDRFERRVTIDRASGPGPEPSASTIDVEGLATEWEWENSPEVTLAVVDSVDRAIELCNRYSPRFVASLIGDDPAEHDRFYASIDAPFVGDGFTRWVDGQYALDAPELGLSNWQGGRMLGRGAILSGDSVHTVRYRATIVDTDLHR